MCRFSKTKLMAFATVLIALMTAQSSYAAYAYVPNGDFEDDFTQNSDSWDYWGDVDHDEKNGNNFAVLYAGDEGEAVLFQELYLPDNVKYLSFDIRYKTNFDGRDYSNPPSFFAAYLIDLDTDDPLVSNPGFDDFFYKNNFGLIDTIAKKKGKTVTLDLEGLGDRDVELWFEVINEWDGYKTKVKIDNVKIGVIPAPGAFLLSAVGLSFVSFLRRRRYL